VRNEKNSITSKRTPRLRNPKNKDEFHAQRERRGGRASSSEYMSIGEDGGRGRKVSLAEKKKNLVCFAREKKERSRRANHQLNGGREHSRKSDELTNS